MITPYTQAAQAPRFDIYDPFPFQEVASMALKKDKAYGDFLADVDKYSADIANISAASNKDKEYLANTKAAIDSTLSDALSKGVDLGDGFAANKLMRDVYKKVDFNRLKNIQGTTAAAEAFEKSKQSYGKDYDPLMDSYKEGTPVSEWDSSKGAWQGKPGLYIDATPTIDSILKGLEPTLLSATNGQFMKYGVSKEIIDKYAGEAANTFASTLVGQANIDRYVRSAELNGVDLSGESRQSIAAQIIADRANEFYKVEENRVYSDALARAAKAKGMDEFASYTMTKVQEMAENPDKSTHWHTEAINTEQKYNDKLGVLYVNSRDLNGAVIKPGNISLIEKVLRGEGNAKTYTEYRNVKNEYDEKAKELATIENDIENGVPAAREAAIVMRPSVTKELSKLETKKNAEQAKMKAQGLDISKTYSYPTPKEEAEAYGIRLAKSIDNLQGQEKAVGGHNTKVIDGKTLVQMDLMVPESQFKARFEAATSTDDENDPGYIFKDMSYDKYLSNLGASVTPYVNPETLVESKDDKMVHFTYWKPIGTGRFENARRDITMLGGQGKEPGQIRSFHGNTVTMGE